MPATLTLVAEFDHQVTGVALTQDGRTFVNFPRWTEDSAVSVAELMADGSLRPYPDEEWNGWRNARKNEVDPADHFVCVQSVVADGRGHLWVLDPAAPATSHLVPGGAKLVCVSLADDSVAKVIPFGPDIAPEGSYLNDIRFSPDGRTGYLTDSGATGALVVVDLESGSARRVLSGKPCTQPEDDVVVHTDGRPLRRPDGRGAEFAADGIEVTPDGEWVVWQALTGRTMFRVRAADLADTSLSDDDLAGRVETVGRFVVSDGYWMTDEGHLYLSAVEDKAIVVLTPDHQHSVLLSDDRLRWPDSFAQRPGGPVHVTTSRIMDNAWFDPDAAPAIATQLWRIDER